MSTENSFLDNDYEVPSSGGNFMKFQQGENRFRIISKPVLGWVGWSDDKKVHRFPFKQKPTAPIGKEAVRHFWAMIVYNVTSGSIQILEVTQNTIQSQIADLSKSEDWGAPYGYDIKVNKEGADKQTKYTVVPCPKKAVTPEIEKMALEKPIDLAKLFVKDGDPFNVSDGKSTELIINDLPF